MVMVCLVCLSVSRLTSVGSSVCHMRISPKLGGISVLLLGNSNRNPDFPIQNLPSDSRPKVRFRLFVRQEKRRAFHAPNFGGSRARYRSVPSETKPCYFDFKHFHRTFSQYSVNVYFQIGYHKIRFECNDVAETQSLEVRQWPLSTKILGRRQGKTRMRAE